MLVSAAIITVRVSSESVQEEGDGTYAGGEGVLRPPPKKKIVKCLISPWFLGIFGKSRTFIKNLDTCVKPFLGDFTSCNYSVKSQPNY